MPMVVEGESVMRCSPSKRVGATRCRPSVVERVSSHVGFHVGTIIALGKDGTDLGMYGCNPTRADHGNR